MRTTTNVIFFLLISLNCYCMKQEKISNPELIALRKKLEPNNAIKFDLPPSISIIKTEQPNERLGKCLYIAMADILGIANQKAPFKMLEPRDWLKNIDLIQYFNQTDTPHKGDLAVYYPDNQPNSEPLHFGVVAKNKNSNILIKSKWGLKPEVLEHPLYTAPLSYESSAKFFRLKPEYQKSNGKKILLAKLQDAINSSAMVKEDMELLEKFLSELANGNNIIIAQQTDINQYKTIQDKIRYLLKSYPGLNINTFATSIYTPLMLAAMRGDYETTKLLIDFSADINKQNKDGNTALIMADKRSREDIIPLLLESGAEPNIKNNYGYQAKIEAYIEKK